MPEGYILVCLATSAQVEPVSADGTRIEEGVRVVRCGRQAGRTEGHTWRGQVRGARVGRVGQAAPGTSESRVRQFARQVHDA